jgi:hypothetical protein
LKPELVCRQAQPERAAARRRRQAGGQGLWHLSRLGTRREVVVIDEQGIGRYHHDQRVGLDYQSVDELKAALDTIPAAAAQ